MVILKKIFRNSLIVLGILTAVLILMLFCMYFFNTKIFGYGFKKPERNNLTLNIVNSIKEVEINTYGIAVSVEVGDKNQITLEDKAQGVVKLVDGEYDKKVVPKLNLELTETENKAIITLKEPEKLFLLYGSSNLTITLKKSILSANDFALKINTTNSNVEVDSAGNKISEINFEAKNKGNITVKNELNTINSISSKGKINLSNISGDAFFETKSSTVKVKKVGGDLNFLTEKGYIDFEEIGGDLVFSGFSKTAEGGYELKRSAGGKITGKTINGKLFINSKNIDCNISKLFGMADVYASYSGNIKINEFYNDLDENKIKTAKGNVSLGKVDVKNLTIETTNGHIKAKFMGSYGEEAKILAKTTYGDIDITGMAKTIVVKEEAGKNVEEEVESVFVGELSVATSKGDILLKEINAKLDAKVEKGGRGKITVYFGTQFRNESIITTNRGELKVYIKELPATPCHIIADAKKSKSINVGVVKEFLADGAPTPVCGAGETVERLLSLKSLDSKVIVRGYF